MQIIKVSVCEFFADPAWPELRAGYAAECGVQGLEPIESLPMYLAMEKTGLIDFYAAKVDGQMIGFVTVLTNIMPHYSMRVSITESLYVAPMYRKTGAGLKLIRHAERMAKEAGSPGLFVSAPAGSRLETLLPRLKYRHSNTIFFKDFGNE